MKNSLLLFSLLFLCAFGSCRKENQQPESTWTIDGETFRTHDGNVEVIGRNQRMISASWKANEVKAGYGSSVVSRLPPDGIWSLDIGITGQNPDYLSIGFEDRRDGGYRFYETKDPTAFVKVSHPDGIFTMELPPTRYRLYDDTLKTVLISATLRYKEQ